DTYKMEIIAGRQFSTQYGTDDSLAYVLNESAIKKLGWASPDKAVGKPLQYGGTNGRVIGVLKDFHFESLHNEIVPIVFLITKENNWRVSARIRPENNQATIGFLEDLWKELRPQYPFEYTFLDDRYDALYKSEEQLMKVFGVFSALAILIACLGLFGLASFTTEQRTKEIGIRKVLGASVSRIVTLLNKEFGKWVLIANIIAWPMAWWGMNRWLQNFAYRADLSLLTFAISGLMAFSIAVVTVSYLSVRAALSNPVDAIKYE
ncbi:MAG: FtsX-like permease family protein, partial [Caldithrix sp.]|nr:FtsX-like permease family protein [Caldithrix sp.]